MAAAKGMTADEYREKILFPHGKDWIKARFQKFLSLHPDAEVTPKMPNKSNISKASRVISWQKSSKKQDCKKMHEQLESPTLWRNERRKTAAHSIFVLF